MSRCAYKVTHNHSVSN